MDIVLIHWKIHPNEEAKRGFLEHWRKNMDVQPRDNLVGEYLSEPLTPEQVKFPCGVFNVPQSAKYWSFFNVGLWRDAESFRKQIVEPYVGPTPKTQWFEAEYRERMVLSPMSLRAGNAAILPTKDAFIDA